MNKDQLKQLVRQIVKEAIGLGVAETNLQESAPPNFPAALKKKLLSRYKDVPQKAYATMWKMHNAKNEGNQRVCEMWAAYENKGMNEAGENITVKATVQNNVYPMSEQEIKSVVKKYGVKIKFIGDAAFDTSTSNSYSFTLTGPSGQVDALVNELAEENGIEFQDSKGMNEDVSGMNVAYIAHVDNTVYPMTGDEIASIVQKHNVKMEWMGNAKYGKVWDDERTKYYEFKISGPTGEVDALVDELSQENGIDFVPTAKLGESHDETDMNNPEEKREVKLAKKAKAAAAEILKMHGK